MPNDKDPGQEPSQNEEKPNSRFTEQTETASSGQAPATFAELVEQYPDFEDYIEKKVQSKSDSRLGKYGNRLDSLEEGLSSTRQTLDRVQALKDEGFTEKQAVREIEREEKLKAIETQLQERPNSVGTESKSLMEREQDVLNHFGVDQGDHRFVEFIKESKDLSDAEYLENLQSQGRAWRTADANKPKPNTSVATNTTPASPGTSEYGDMTDDDLGAKLGELALSDPRETEERDKIKAELERRETK